MRTESVPAAGCTRAATTGTGWACWLLYTSTGARERFSTRVPGSACAARRSPHSNAAPLPAEMITQLSRSVRVRSAFSYTPNSAGSASMVTVYVPESRAAV